MDMNLIECFSISSNVSLDPRLVYEIFLILSIRGVMTLALTLVVVIHSVSSLHLCSHLCYLLPWWLLSSNYPLCRSTSIDLSSPLEVVINEASRSPCPKLSIMEESTVSTPSFDTIIRSQKLSSSLISSRWATRAWVARHRWWPTRATKETGRGDNG